MAENKRLLSALWYVEKLGFSVLPVGNDKKPLIKWEELQTRLPSKKEILEWWLKYPDANVGIITGKVSNLAVIDIDDPKIDNETIKGIEQYLEPPACVTPRGGRHLYFRYPKDTDLRNATSIIPKVDIRAEGGYVVAPPSTDSKGNIYKWFDDKRIDKTAMCEFPMSVISLTVPAPSRRLYTVPTDMFKEGRRDEDLFHMANIMVKGGASPAEIQLALETLAKSCTPPFPENEIQAKIYSAMKRAEKRERNLADEIKRWVDIQDGYFDIATLYKDLGITTPSERGNCYVAISRLVKDGTIEKYGKKAGQYRVANLEVEVMNWEGASTKDMNITYPLGIENYVVTYPSNIIVIAGATNCGKTTFLLDFARRNLKYHDVHYFNSEMGEGELKMRLGLFQNCETKDWKKVTFYNRGSNYDDVIKPDKINIIDYLEVLNDFWMVGEQIRNIHKKLTTGIAVIAIQKNKGVDLGRGGSFGSEKPRSYLSMDYGHLKMIKAKNWRTTENPNGLETDFKIAGGWKFIQDEKGWYRNTEAK
jgi:Bifunctional DNA primase/polymerase, N-terminal